MTDNELKVIRQNISCPQFGDEHYGAWGALRIDQRKAIYRMWDEINRQKEQIDGLINGQETLQKYIAEQKAEIERLKKGWKADVILTANVKAEAIKEFAEKLESKLANNTYISAVGYEAVVFDMHNLVKEMVGEQNG